MNLKILGLLAFIGVITAEDMGGHPGGFLSTCPNITVPVTKHDLKYLFFVAYGVNGTTSTRYNYYHIDQLPKNRQMDWTRKTMVYFGGYGDSPDFVVAKAMGRLYRNRGYNVIMVDNGYFMLLPLFPVTYASIHGVSLHVAEMLATLYKSGVMDPAKVEMLGISLGCHTMGITGKRFYELTGRKISRLTAMDPSGPCFRNAEPQNRLDKTDGEYVEAIHTNIDVFGAPTAVGHIDFYLNGGENQLASASVLLYCDAACSHMKSFFTWVVALSVPEANFIAIKCNSIQQARLRQCYDNKPLITNKLGLDVNKTKHGIYYLSTNHKFPYYKGKDGLRKETEEVPIFLAKMINSYNMLRKAGIIKS